MNDIGNDLFLVLKKETFELSGVIQKQTLARIGFINEKTGLTLRFIKTHYWQKHLIYF